MSSSPSAAELLRSVGLMADGPAVWGRPVPSSRAGVFVLELPAALASPPIEITKVGKWIERVETLRLDGARPTSKGLAARLAAFWLPSQTVVYIGSTETSIARRVAAIAATELGDRRPNAAAHWLRTLRSLDGLRIWWAATDAPEEYEDALLGAFADAIPGAERNALPDTTVVLPFANLRRPTGERKATGLTGSLIPEPVTAPTPPTRVVQVPDGDAEGARGEPPAPRGPTTTRRTTSAPVAPSAAAGAAATGSAGAAQSAAGAGPSAPAAGAAAPGSAGAGAAATQSAAPRPVAASPARVPTPPGPTRGSVHPIRPGSAHAQPTAATSGSLTSEGAARLRAELDELTTVKRPAVIARVRTAREHGDLKENAEYHAAREEQSFLEGRIQALEARLRTAVIVEAPSAGSRVGLGSVVGVEEDDGTTATYTIVGAAESNPSAGRISSSSPVGRALVGRDVGDEVEVATPAGSLRYRIVSIA